MPINIAKKVKSNIELNVADGDLNQLNIFFLYPIIDIRKINKNRDTPTMSVSGHRNIPFTGFTFIISSINPAIAKAMETKIPDS